MRAFSRIMLVLAVSAVAFGSFAAAPAHGAEGPKVTLNQSEAAPGEPVLVTISGFRARAVAISVCGNLARRGSADCAMASSQGKEIDQYHDVTLAQLIVQSPPLPCPCLVRVTSTNGDEFAVTPLVVTGHPEAPIVAPPDARLVEVGVSAQRQSDSIADSLRSALGGRTTYSVTVTVRNITTETLANVQLRATAANRWSDELAKVPLDAPGPIDPGQTWTKTVAVELPAPVFGEIRWNVIASGAGQTIETTKAITAVPWLLYLFVVAFVADLVALVWRWRKRRRASGGTDGDRGSEDTSPPEADVGALEAMWSSSTAAESELTGAGR